MALGVLEVDDERAALAVARRAVVVAATLTCLDGVVGVIGPCATEVDRCIVSCTSSPSPLMSVFIVPLLFARGRCRNESRQ